MLCCFVLYGIVPRWHALNCGVFDFDLSCHDLVGFWLDVWYVGFAFDVDAAVVCLDVFDEFCVVLV